MSPLYLIDAGRPWSHKDPMWEGHKARNPTEDLHGTQYGMRLEDLGLCV